MLPDPIKKFVDAFSGLPGIGPRQATRLAFYIVAAGQSTISEFGKAIFGLSDMQRCSQCFAPYSNANNTNSMRAPRIDGEIICCICSDPQRRKDLIAVVEKETDLLSLEKTKKFNGRYLVLGDLKKDGMLDSTHKLRLNNLKSWIKKEFTNSETSEVPKLTQSVAAEIIIAINPTTYGDINADLIANELKNSAKRITRLGRGIPTGGEIEFADEDTLGGAIDNRK